jgi:hypothetical protein
MKVFAGKAGGFVLLLGAGMCLVSWAQGTTNIIPRFRNGATNLLPPVPMPPTTESKSPVELFRELLAMNPVERMQALSNRPPENRRLILVKVREYESLNPNQRELRLKATELRWYLWPLMNSTSTNLEEQVVLIPEGMRELVKVRLEAWHELAAGVKSELLTNEATLRFFTELTNSTPQQRTNMLRKLSPARQAMLQAGVQEIQAMPEEQRSKLFERFNEFFDLTATEKVRALNTLSEAERQQIEKTLKRFGQLTPENRRQCMLAMQKFVSLSVGERQQFLKNARRWQCMTPEQRQSWCGLVNTLSEQPPLPKAANLPPLPPILRKPVSKTAQYGPAVATN